MCLYLNQTKTLFLLPGSFGFLDFEDGDATVKFGFVQSKAQGHRLSEGGGEGVKVGEVSRPFHLREGDGSCTVVQGYGDPVVTHLVIQASLSAVVPGSEFSVMLLR